MTSSRIKLIIEKGPREGETLEYNSASVIKIGRVIRGNTIAIKDAVLAPKDKGGLGIGSLKAHNYALLVKWWWKLHDGKKAIWKEVVKEIHNLAIKPKHIMAKKVGGVWLNITKIGEELGSLGLNYSNLFGNKIGNGESLMFWKDIWVGNTPLENTFPALYKIEKTKRCYVKDRLGPLGPTWNWTASTLNNTQAQELNCLLSTVSDVELCNKMDSVSFTQGEEFTVSITRKLLDEKIVSSSNIVMKWSRLVPLKVNCFVWRVNMERIPVAKNLLDRGMIINSSNCSFCKHPMEDTNHVFIDCVRAKEIMDWIFKWCGIINPQSQSVPQLLGFVTNWAKGSSKGDILYAVFMCAIWSIWKARNELVFNGNRKPSSSVADDIVSLFFMWVKSRGKRDIQRVVWECNPLL